MSKSNKNYNVGNNNAGCFNVGCFNVGDGNVGSHNDGDLNVGCFNVGDGNVGDCNTTTPTVRLFNCDSGLPLGGEVHNRFRAIVNAMMGVLVEWVAVDVMTGIEKLENPEYESDGGYLQINKSTRNSIPLAPEDRAFLVGLPNFDAEVLKECTGIDIGEEKVRITLEGKDMWISKELAETIKAQLSVKDNSK